MKAGESAFAVKSDISKFANSIVTNHAPNELIITNGPSAAETLFGKGMVKKK